MGKAGGLMCMGVRDGLCLRAARVARTEQVVQGGAVLWRSFVRKVRMELLEQNGGLGGGRGIGAQKSTKSAFVYCFPFVSYRLSSLDFAESRDEGSTAAVLAAAASHSRVPPSAARRMRAAGREESVGVVV